eukprot:scaffold93159_cov57-Phaeocystis_antarctica.AAC.1
MLSTERDGTTRHGDSWGLDIDTGTTKGHPKQATHAIRELRSRERMFGCSRMIHISADSAQIHAQSSSSAELSDDS